jgi:mono/diheme cytochrome c family protein
MLLRQLAVLLLILVIWGGVLYWLFNASGASGTAALAEVTATPPATATLVPTQAATLPASNTPAPTASRTPTVPAATGTPTPTVAPTATSMPTDTPVPAETTVPVDTPAAVATATDTTSAAISFQRDVQPIFNQICVKCHGGDEVKEGLSLKSYAEVMRGSDNGAVIVPGDPANSFLIEQIQSGEMPKRGPKLLPGQIRAIVDWVSAGAPNN